MLKAEALLVVTVANLKVVKMFAGTRGRVMDRWILSTGQAAKTLWSKKIKAEQAGGLTGPNYSHQLSIH